MPTITHMITVKNYEVLQWNKSNIIGTCTSGNYAKEWFSTLYNYYFVALGSRPIQSEEPEQKYTSQNFSVVSTHFNFATLKKVLL
jgi:hypothetical protein